MSVRTMARVWERSQHSGSDLLMLLAIADFADDDGNAYPAVGTLAKKCRMTPRNANFILANLKQSGELVVRQNEGPKGTNRYLVRPPEACFTTEEHFTLKPASPTPEAHFPKPLKPASDEPSENHQEPSTRACKRENRGFAEFWKAYPKKKGIGAAEKAWAKHKPDLQTVLQAIESAKATPDWRKDNGQYIPHPATWLNQRRWEDDNGAEVAPASKAADASPKAGDTRNRHGVKEVYTEGTGWVPA